MTAKPDMTVTIKNRDGVAVTLPVDGNVWAEPSPASLEQSIIQVATRCASLYIAAEVERARLAYREGDGRAAVDNWVGDYWKVP